MPKFHLAWIENPDGSAYRLGPWTRDEQRIAKNWAHRMAKLVKPVPARVRRRINAARRAEPEVVA